MGFFWKAAVEETDERGKTFHWVREKRVWIHLTAFLLFSVLIHGSGFYLFKVVYPSPVRVEPRPDGILVVEPSDPASRSVLQRLADRTVFLHSPSADSENRVGLENRRVHFSPAFQRAEMDPLPPPVLERGPGTIEPLPLSAVSAESGPGDLFKVDPALLPRGLAPWSVLGDYLELADTLPRARLALEVARDGTVRVTGVEAAMEEREKQDFAAVVESTLRFLPGGEPASGWIEIGGG